MARHPNKEIEAALAHAGCGLDRYQVIAGSLLGDHPLFPRSRRLSEIGVVHSEEPGESRQGNSTLRQEVSARIGGGAMKTHRFTLVLAGVSEITPELADALYEATDGDIEFNMRNGIAYL